MAERGTPGKTEGAEGSRGAYDPESRAVQQALVLAFTAYMTSGKIGSPKAIEEQSWVPTEDLLKDPQITGVIGEWTRVWGPGVFQAAGSRMAVNTCVVFYSATQREYVVAVSGTNPLSIYDWLFLDLNVGAQCAWHPQFKQCGNVSAGPFMGYRDILRIQYLDDPDKPYSPRSNPKRSLIQFLVDEAIKPSSPEVTKITVVGHSLGGALAPLLALHLRESVELQARRKDRRFDVHCIAFAGPTCGNEQFSQYFNKALGDNVILVTNERDIVPNAFEEHRMDRMASIYQAPPAGIPCFKFMQGFLAGTKLYYWNKGYTHVRCAVHDWFEPTGLTYTDPVFQRPNSTGAFMFEVARQHTVAYFHHCGCPSVLDVIARRMPLFRETLNCDPYGQFMFSGVLAGLQAAAQAFVTIFWDVVCKSIKEIAYVERECCIEDDHDHDHEHHHDHSSSSS
jgi:pimeloyl-ACP methyl ester carboxylesterase